MKTPVNHHFPMVFTWFSHVPMVLPEGRDFTIEPVGVSLVFRFGLLSPGGGPSLSAACDPSRHSGDKGGNDDTPRTATHGWLAMPQTGSGELRYGKSPNSNGKPSMMHGLALEHDLPLEITRESICS